MRNYKMVCSDLDGTLLNNKSKVSRENLLAMDELMKRGICFVPSTGRTFSELPAEIKNNPSIRWFIYSNGAAILDRQTNRRYLTCMSHQVAQSILNIVYGCATHISIRQNGNCYVDAAYADQASFDYYNVCEAHRVVVNDYAIKREDFKEFCSQADEVEVISVFFREYEEMVICKTMIEQLGGLRVVGVAEYNLEIMHINAGKGNALRCLAKELGVDLEETIGIGDSENDNSIIETAGLGLAVSNACKSLKDAADEIICSNEEHAIAYVAAHYF